MARRRAPSFAGLLVLPCALLASSRAHAWVEAHVTRDEARVTLDRTGVARIEHRITLKVEGGPLRSLDVAGVDADAVPDPDGYVVTEREAVQSSLGSAVPIVAELVVTKAKGEAGPEERPTLRLRLGDGGIKRGTWVVFVRYTTRLPRDPADANVPAAIQSGGAMARVRWRGPVWEDGLDQLRATFVLPPAPNEPAPLEDMAADDGEPSGFIAPTFLSTVRRSPDKDEIELVRPYAPKGEAVTWRLRVDPRAIRPRADDAPAPASAPSRLPGVVELADPRGTIALAAAAAIFLVYAFLVAAKARGVRRRAEAAGAKERPLVPLPWWVRAPAAGLALTAGLYLELALPSGTVGAALVTLAIALAAQRRPLPLRRALRGPGRWLPVAEAEALRPPPRPKGSWLDASTRAGKVLLVLCLGAVGAGVWAAAQVSTYHATLLALDAAAILVIFGTGRRCDLPVDLAVDPVPMLRDVARRVRRMVRAKDELRVVARVRIPDDRPDADEVRLALVPRAPLAGFSAIEIGVTFAEGPGGAVAMPEVLLRCTAGSACETATAPLARHGRASRGRRPEERVLAFSPRLPTARMTAAIAVALASRVADPARWTRAPASAAAPPAPVPDRPGRKAKSKPRRRVERDAA